MAVRLYRKKKAGEEIKNWQKRRGSTLLSEMIGEKLTQQRQEGGEGMWISGSRQSRQKEKQIQRWECA